jgi:lipoprotein-anchoring transpeptidase ErfK/SrfK
LKTVAALLLAAALACAAAPAAERVRVLPLGVTVSGVHVGGLAAEPARARIEAAFDRPIPVVYEGSTAVITPASLAAHANINAALAAAFAATPGSRIALPLRFSTHRVGQAVTSLAREHDEAPVSAILTGATAAGPELSPSRAGVAVDTKRMAAAIAQVLHAGTRPQLRLLTNVVPPARTVANFGSVIVVDRSTNELHLYDGRRLVRTFPVATGQAIYPTPAGLWHIVDKQRDPWWYPPTYDSWAKGLKPVPPGPSNPLGTRWMGLSAPGVGIHGTDAPTSIGYSASHGCIRMHVPDAEWLFERVSVGTPVVVI